MNERGKDLIIIGIGFGHLATVAVMINGEIVFAVSEERLRRVKNYVGFPSLAYQEALRRFCQGNADLVDVIAIPTDSNQEFDFYIAQCRFPDGRYFKPYRFTEKSSIPREYSEDREALGAQYIREEDRIFEALKNDAHLSERAVSYYAEKTGVGKEKIQLIDHHTAHCYSSLLFIEQEAQSRTLVFTLDGCGDNLCASVSVAENGQISRLSSCPRYFSPGRFYREVTAFLGLRPDEDEFKVMGLAAYGRPDDYKGLAETFQALLSVDASGKFTASCPIEFSKWFLLDRCAYERFDHLAGAAQFALESWTIQWITYWIQKTGIANIALAGGVFLNVKLNQKILELDSVAALSVVPSSGDESNPFGACVFAARHIDKTLKIVRVKHLYLGSEIEEEDLERQIQRCSLQDRLVIVRSSDLLSDVTELLIKNEPVGWVQGRAEWGARGLGARSLIANPGDPTMVQRINSCIKSRDFWMPFAPSIISDEFESYVENPKMYPADFMNMSFETKESARSRIPAAIHQADFTCRPQKVSRTTNSLYYDLIRRFQDRTGTGALLNTSLNLHGQPVVETARDVCDLMLKSKLKYMVSGSYILRKRNLSE